MKTMTTIRVLGLYLLATSLLNAQTALRLPDLIEEGLANNPGIRAGNSRAEAATHKIPRAGALPDPTLAVAAMNLPLDSFVFDQEPMTGKQLQARQMIPFPGKLALRTEVARKGARVADLQVTEAENRLRRDISLTFFDLYYIDEAISTIRKNQALLREFVKVAEQKYAVGKGLQQDVLKAQVELSLMAERLINLHQRREGLEAKLNRLLNRPPTAPVGHVEAPVLRTQKYIFEQLSRQARENRPLLLAAEVKIQQGGDLTALARRNLLPDFGVSTAYTQRSVLQSGMGGVDYLSLGVSLNLPIYSGRKQKQKVQEQQILVRSQEENLEALQQNIDAALDRELADLTRHADLLELYRSGIIPQAAQSLESTLTGYQTDKVDFLTLIASQMTLFNLELKQAHNLSDFEKDLVELEYLVGSPIQGQ